MNDAPPPVVRVVRRFSASAEQVFDAWLDPRLAGRFLFATPTGEMIRVEIDPQVGGRYVFTERRSGDDVEHTGQYLVIDRPRRLVFTLQVPKYSPTVDQVTLDIEPLAVGCELRLTHRITPEWLSFLGQIENGWNMILDNLAPLFQPA